MGNIHTNVEDPPESQTVETDSQSVGGVSGDAPGGEGSGAAPVPKKRPTVIRAKPITTPPAEMDLAVPTEKAEPQRPKPLHNRLSGSAFALHIEDDNHAIVPRELRNSRPELAPKPGKPPKPSIKPKPALPSKPKPVIATKPKKQEKTTWYTAPPEENNMLIDFTSPKKTEPFSFKPTIIRSTSKPILNSETTLQLPPENGETCPEEEVPSATQEVHGATPFDSPRKDDAQPQVKRPTIIKPNRPKAKSTQNGLSMKGSQSVSNISEAANSASNTADQTNLESSKQTILQLANNSAQNNVPLKRQPPPVLAKPSVRPKSIINPSGSEVAQNIANEEHVEKTLAKAQSKPERPLNNNTEVSKQYNQFEDSFYENSTDQHSDKQNASAMNCLSCDNQNDSFYDHSCANSSDTSGKQTDQNQLPVVHSHGPIGFEGLMSQQPSDKTSIIPTQQQQKDQENQVQEKAPSLSGASAQSTQDSSTEQKDIKSRTRLDSAQSGDSIGTEISITQAEEKSPKPSRPSPISVQVEGYSPVLDASRDRSGSSPRAPSPSPRGPSPVPR